MRTGSKANKARLWSTRSPAWLPIEAVAGDLAVLGDGTLVAALEVVPVDTALLSEEVKLAYLTRFWQGLRSLHFPVSVYVGTRRQEVADYMETVTRRLDELAEVEGQQEGLFGMLLEEQCRLLGVLLAEHLRSRYSLLVVSHNPNLGLKGAARSLVGGNRPSVPPANLAEARTELELKVRKVEDVLRQVGLKYTRRSGQRLAAELLWLSHPELAIEESARLKASLETTAVISGRVGEGGSREVAS